MLEKDHKRYVGAQIGVYNPDGVKVGKISHLRNKELLFIVTRHIRRVARVNSRLRSIENRHGAGVILAS